MSGPHRWVDDQQRVRAFAAWRSDLTHGIGRVKAYSQGPQVLIERDNGETFWWRADLCEPAPAQPAVAPDTQSAAPTRDALVAAFKTKFVISGYDIENDALEWRAADEFDEAERMADVALGVLRGGGADGGGEDEAGRYPGVQLTRDSIRIHAEALTENLNAALREKQGIVARLAMAAGVPPDSEDVVGAIEAAIRAMRADTETCCNGCGVCDTWGHLRCWLHDEDGGDRELRSLLCGEPEFAVGPDVGRLPIGSRFVMVDETRRAQVGSKVRVVDGNPNRVYGEENVYRVLYRAPAPTPAPLTVGDELRDVDDLRRAGVGAWVQYAPNKHNGKRQRALVTSNGVFDGEVRAVCSEHGEELTFDKLVNDVWPMRLCGLPDGDAS